MKNKISQCLKLYLIVLGLTLLVFNCQQEDDLEKQNQTQVVNQKSTIKTVSAKDVPEVLNFIQSKSNRKMQFRLDDSNSPEGQYRSHEENLSLTTTLTEQIKQVTNNFGKSNYTFNLIEEDTKEGVYFLNLVVKEYRDTFYLYIMKHVPETTWLINYRNPSDLGSFTGTIYYYSEQGIYLAKAEMLDGVSISVDRHPCDGDDQDDDTSDDDTSDNGSSGSGSGSGSNSDAGTSDGSTDGSSSGSNNNSGGGTGGSNVDVVYVCCSCEGELVGADGHDHIECYIEIIFNLSTESNGNTINDDKSFNDYLRHPCDNDEDECPAEIDCEYGWDDNCQCLDEPDENNDVGVLLDFNSYTFNNFINTLDDDLQDWINDEENLEIREDIFDFLVENNFDEQSLEFIELAIETLMEDGEVDLPNRVILHNSFTTNQKVNCVYGKLSELSSTLFNDIIDDHFGSSNNSNIRFEIAPITTGEDAQTRPFNSSNSGTNYQIVLDTNFVANASTLEIALAIIHESIHAEALERCMQLGLVQSAFYNGQTGNVNVIFNNSSTVLTLETLIFSEMLTQYGGFSGTGSSSQWQHDLFNVFNYREEMAQNLVDIHPWLNDSENDFLNNVNNDTFVIGGPYTLEQLMDYVSWIGLEDTQEFINNISSDPVEYAKKDYVEGASRDKYTNTCN